MSHATWKPVVAHLAEAISPASSRQRAVADVLGVPLAADLPKVVASARLRIALDREFTWTQAAPVRDSTEEYLDELAASMGVEVSPESQDDAEAWIQYLYFKGRHDALVDLKVEAGDTVEVIAGSNAGRIALVTSVGDDGAVYLAGRGRAWPDQVGMVARAVDLSAAAEARRTHARNDAAERRGIAITVPEADFLERYRVQNRPTDSEIDRLAATIDAAADEKPVQQFLAAHPWLLTVLLSHEPWYCMPKPRLGGTYEPDFLLADLDSTGMRWLLVELESPRATLALKSSNDFAKEARKGLSQINEWREWLQDNLAMARSLPGPTSHGVGLAGIVPSPDGLLLVGRRASVTARDQMLRRRRWAESRIQVHTYDWLVEKLRRIQEFHGPPAANGHLLHRAPTPGWSDTAVDNRPF